MALNVPENKRFYSLSGLIGFISMQNMHKKSVFQIFNEPVYNCFSTLYKLNTYKNPLLLEDGKFGYISDIKDSHFEWEKKKVAK